MSPSRTPILTPVKSPSFGSRQPSSTEYPEIFQAREETVQYIADAVNKKISQYVVKQVNLENLAEFDAENALELLLRDDFVCMGCRRRKRIGLVFLLGMLGQRMPSQHCIIQANIL